MKGLLFLSILLTTSTQAENASVYQSRTFQVEKKEQITATDLQKLFDAFQNKGEQAFLEQVRVCLSKNPDDTQVLNLLALHSLREGQLDLAKIILNRALNNASDKGPLYNNLGVIALREGRLQRAIGFFKRAGENGSAQSAKVNMAGIQVQHGDFNNALRPLEEAYRKIRSKIKAEDGLSMAIANNYGVALMGTGNYKEAERVYESLASVSGKDINVLLNHAILLVEKMQQTEKAKPIINKLKFTADQPKVLQRIESLEEKIRSVKQ